MAKLTPTQIFLAITLGIFTIGGFIYAGIYEMLLRKDLKNRGITTYGIIYEKDPGRKTFFLYEFDVENQRYTGSFGGYSSWLINVGDTIKLKYDPFDPSRNKWIKSPVPTKKTTNGDIIFSITIVGIVGIYYFFKIRRSLR